MPLNLTAAAKKPTAMCEQFYKIYQEKRKDDLFERFHMEQAGGKYAAKP